MNLALDLPDELTSQVKSRAAAEGKTVDEFVAEILQQALGMTARSPRESATRHFVEIGESGLPVFRCHPDAPAARMTVEELLRVEQDALAQEDLKRSGL